MSQPRASASGPTAGSPRGTESQERKDDPAVRSLRRAWRSLASSLVVAARAAEKTAKAPTAGQDASGAAVDKAVMTTLNARENFRVVSSLVESKLRGNAKEAEALECCMRSQPCVGRKRRRRETQLDAKDGQPEKKKAQSSIGEM